MASETVVHDTLEDCSYLPDRVARVPLRYPEGGWIAPEEFDERLAQGDRRNGLFLYRTACPDCRACEPIRRHVAEFRPNQTQRRVHRKSGNEICISIGAPQVSEERVALYNAHRFGRGLVSDGRRFSAEDYAGFLAETCCQTFEIHYRLGKGPD